MTLYVRGLRKSEAGYALRLPHLFLAFSFLYLVLGNSTRLIPTSPGTDNLPLSEFGLYGLTVFCLMFHRELLLFMLRSLLPFALFLAVSSVYGTMLNGPSVSALFYSVRLLLLLASGLAAGYYLFAIFKRDLLGVLGYFLVTYLFTALFAFVIYVLFPDSRELWSFLSSFGVEFYGDPHQRRLVSAYFDPNYYAAIVVFPFTLSVLAYQRVWRTRYLLLAGLFAVSVALTGSRSGIATFAAVVGVFALSGTVHLFTKRRVKRSLLVVVPATLFLFALASPVYLGALTRTWSRIAEVSTDASAQARFNSFDLGFALFAEQPFFGVGYNYLLIYAQEARGLTSLDSSLQVILVNFGAAGTLFIAALVGWWGVTLWRRFRGRSERHAFAGRCSRYVSLYLSVIILFTSQFNNVLFYQFWLFPVLALATYLMRYSSSINEEKSNAHR